MSHSIREQERIDALLHAYAHNPDRTQRDWLPILEGYAKSQQAVLWELTFAIDPPLYRALLLEGAKRQARESVALVQDAPLEHRPRALLKMSATLCLVQTGASDEALRTGGSWSESVSERIQAWKDEFAIVPGFEQVLQEEMDAMRQRHARIYQAHPTVLPRRAPTAEREFSMPVSASQRVVGEAQWVACNEVPPSILDRLNVFAKEYLPGIRFELSDDGRQWRIWAAQAGDWLEQQTDLQELLSGSYGEAAQQMGVLEGDKEVRPGWDASQLAPVSASPRVPRPR